MLLAHVAQVGAHHRRRAPPAPLPLVVKLTCRPRCRTGFGEERRGCGALDAQLPVRGARPRLLRRPSRLAARHGGRPRDRRGARRRRVRGPHGALLGGAPLVGSPSRRRRTSRPPSRSSSPNRGSRTSEYGSRCSPPARSRSSRGTSSPRVSPGGPSRGSTSSGLAAWNGPGPNRKSPRARLASIRRRPSEAASPRRGALP